MSLPLPKKVRRKLRSKLQSYMQSTGDRFADLCDALIGLIGVAIIKAEAQKLFSKDQLSKTHLNKTDIINELIAKMQTLLPEVEIRVILNNDFDSMYSTSLDIYHYIDFIRSFDKKPFLKDFFDKMYPCPADDLENYLNSIHDLFIYQREGILLEVIEPTVLKDLLTISNGLHDKNAFVNVMEHLNAELIKYAKDNGKILDEANPDAPTLPLGIESKQHILCGYLKEWARKHNFNQNNTAKIHGFIRDTNIFSLLLTGKEIFKDNGVEKKHGPWTHILQFYFVECIKEKLTLTHSSAEIYQLLGSPDFQGKQNIIRRFTIWDNLFDMPSSDFRNPRNITKLLTETELPSLSLLSAIIKREYNNADRKKLEKQMSISLPQTIINFFWRTTTYKQPQMITHHSYKRS